MKEDHTFKLIGILNLFDTVPEFVYPVFVNNNKYYIQDKNDEFTINSFELLTDEVQIENIKPLCNYNVIFPNRKYKYVIGDDKLIGFELKDNNLFLGDYSHFKKYTRNLDIDDEFMKIEIPYYISTNDELLLKKAKQD